MTKHAFVEMLFNWSMRAAMLGVLLSGAMIIAFAVWLAGGSATAVMLPSLGAFGVGVVASAHLGR